MVNNIQSPETIAIHPFFGTVTSERWHLVFHPPSCRGDIGYFCYRGDASPREHYETLVPRLAAFEAFCRNLDACDRRTQEHFASWPLSAGSFELVRVMMSGDGNPFYRLPTHDDPNPFALQYRALNEDAWEYAGITRWPPCFFALFDEAGSFSGIEYEVEKAMRDLPDVIPRPRWENGYRHPYFGRRKLSDDRIATVKLAGRKIPLDLYMNAKATAAFEPEQLDQFVPLAQNLEGLDAKVRSEFPEKVRIGWLEQRFEYDAPEIPAFRRALDRVFPGATGSQDVSRQAFVAALTLKRGSFSLSPKHSGGAALTLDYAILPSRVDNNMFAARFLTSGDLLEIVMES